METKSKRLPVKKLVLGLALLSTTIPAAYALNCPNLLPVCRPEFCGRFAIGLEGDYFKPVGIDAPYGYHYNFTQYTTTNLVAPAGTAYDIDELVTRLNSHWGYRADLTYYLPCTSNDLQLIWQDYKHSNSNYNDVGAFTANTVGGVVTVSNPNGFLADLNTFSVGIGSIFNVKVKTNYSAVDLVAGQHINLGSKFNVRPFAGLRYAHLKVNVDTYTEARIVPGNFSLFQVVSSTNQARSNIDSLGLRSGTDIKYCLGSGLSLIGSFGGSLLTGSVKRDLSFINKNYTVTSGVTNFNFTRSGPLHYPSRQAVVPELDARLALNYACNFGCDCRSTLGIDVGYQETYYFKMQDRLFPNSPSREFTTRNPQQNDFGLRGPFVRLSYAF